MLPNGFEQLELFETSPTGELIPAFDFDYSDVSEKEGEKWQDIVAKRKTDR